MSDITETMTVKNGQAAVKTVTVAGTLSPKTSATDTIALVETSDGKQAALKVYSINGGGDYDAEIEALENAVSVLTTSVELSTEIGETTVVLLDELLTLDVDGRPDYKAPGATVYAENGVTGIIDTIDDSAQTAVVKTVSVSTGGDGLPDQTDNAGKFLTTDGSTVSWGNALVNLASVGSNSIQVKGDYTATTFPDIYRSCLVTYSGFISANDALAVGYNASVTAHGATQLGSGTNADANTFKVSNKNGNFTIMSADGTIPADRLPNILEIEEF